MHQRSWLDGDQPCKEVPCLYIWVLDLLTERVLPSEGEVTTAARAAALAALVALAAGAALAPVFTPTAVITFTTVIALSTNTKTGKELPKNADETRSVKRLDSHEVSANMTYFYLTRLWYAIIREWDRKR